MHDKPRAYTLAVAMLLGLASAIKLSEHLSWAASVFQALDSVPVVKQVMELPGSLLVALALLALVIWYFLPKIAKRLGLWHDGSAPSNTPSSVNIGHISGGNVNIYQNVASLHVKPESDNDLPAQSASTMTVNPLDSTFEKKVIYLTDLVKDVFPPIIRDKSFKNCRIVGSAVVCLDATNLISK